MEPTTERIVLQDLKVVMVINNKEVYVKLEDLFELKHKIDCNMTAATLEIEEKE